MRAETLKKLLKEATEVESGVRELPAWRHPINAGVLPLLVTREQRFEPVGTAFVFTRYGHIVTARHNLDELLKKEPGGDRLLQRDMTNADLNLKVAGLAVLHTYDESPERGRVALWPIDRISGAPPTDIVFGSPVRHREQEVLPVLNLPITFDAPRVGAIVSCVGYPRIEAPQAGISYEELRSGEWLTEYRQRLMVVEGRVRKVFTRRFARGYAEGPCFSIEADVDHGFSGGPVVNADGYVCGVLWAGATVFFPEPTALASLLFPTFLTSIPTRLQMAQGKFQMNFNRPLCEVIVQGGVETDGSEERVPLVREGDGYRVNLMALKTDAPDFHDEFRGAQDGVGASPEPEPKALFLRRNTEDRASSAEQDPLQPSSLDGESSERPDEVGE